MFLELALGDAYGAGFEFSPPAKIARLNTGLAYAAHDLGEIAPGRYTDDTQMSVAVAEALLAADPARAADALDEDAFARHYVAAFRRDPRPGYAKGLAALLQDCVDGADLRRRIRPDSRRNGAAMRAIPIGLLADEAAVLRVAAASARVTHDTPEGIASAQAIALMAHALARGGRALAELPGLVQGRLGTTLDLGWSAEVACDGPQTVHAVAASLLRHRSLAALLVACVALGGDTDSVAALALGLASLSPEYARDLPPELVAGLEDGPFGAGFLQGLEARLAAHLGVRLAAG